MIEKIRLLLLTFLIYLHQIINFKLFLIIIKYVGGPLFTKLLQTFSNLNNSKAEDTLNGSIGSIIIKKDFVIKNLHTNIDSKLEDSLKILNSFLKYNNIPFPFYYSEFEIINKKQLNLNIEKEYSLQLRNIFKNIKNVKIIDIFYSSKNYHYSKFIKGYRIDYFLSKYPNYQKEIFFNLYLSYYLMLSKNIFHCDWHFGNFLVNLNEENEIVLYILDTGLMGKLENTKFHNKLLDLFKVNLLKLEPINIVKFLSFINLNKNANTKNFITQTKHIQKLALDNSKKILLIFKNATINQLKFPIVILYMFQGIIFLDEFLERKYLKDLKSFSDRMGFTSEIVKTICI